ncbi:hypothetical protein AURDEDRAFT_140079 [Auricularia subglabra TFB-10046 SS5]|uniref:DDE-1 domain-containing protein n=1 Tax=Auricularia subglabra (strain TFB-10046 / SS5) TaxID=717982 RepID=J0WUF9_AURST|nr:hypothetical protein AURDEDRAFT_140079 [Auricularia subglabra TFB-10046 SS5]
MHSLGFSPHRPTRAAQKVPADADDQGWKMRMRGLYLSHKHFIPAALWANTDQTQLKYAFGTDYTWEATGSKQVSVLGQEEKRAFTLNVRVSLSGELLPFQAIYQGKTNKSLPRNVVPGYERSQQLGFRFLPSKTDTYWSTQETMQDYVDTVVAPYFERQRIALGLPPHQRAIWMLDSWTVHRSAAFRAWMKAHHPLIFMLYVPANCTSLIRRRDRRRRRRRCEGS